MVKRRQEKTREEFAAKLRRARESQFRSQKAFAEVCGFQPETYRMWERGDREPSLTNLKKIALALGASLDELILGLRPAETLKSEQVTVLNLDVPMPPKQWEWESDRQHNITIPLLSKGHIGKRRQDYGINPSLPWGDVETLMDNHKPIIGLKFQYIFKGRLISVSVSGNPLFDQDNEFIGYRGTGYEIEGAELDAYLQSLAGAN